MKTLPLDVLGVDKKDSLRQAEATSTAVDRLSSIKAERGSNFPPKEQSCELSIVMVKHWLELTLGGVTEEMVKLEALESMLLLFVVTERSSSKMLFKFVRCEYSVKKSKEVSDCCSILWWLEVLLSEINLGKSSRSHSSAATADSWELIKFEPGDSADRDSSAEEVPLPMLPGEVEQLLVGVWLGLERRASRKSCRVGLMRPASR